MKIQVNISQNYPYHEVSSGSNHDTVIIVLFSIFVTRILFLFASLSINFQNFSTQCSVNLVLQQNGEEPSFEPSSIHPTSIFFEIENDFICDDVILNQNVWRMGTSVKIVIMRDVCGGKLLDVCTRILSQLSLWVRFCHCSLISNQNLDFLCLAWLKVCFFGRLDMDSCCREMENPGDSWKKIWRLLIPHFSSWCSCPEPANGDTRLTIKQQMIFWKLIRKILVWWKFEILSFRYLSNLSSCKHHAKNGWDRVDVMKHFWQQFVRQLWRRF